MTNKTYSWSGGRTERISKIQFLAQLVGTDLNNEDNEKFELMISEIGRHIDAIQKKIEGR